MIKKVEGDYTYIYLDEQEAQEVRDTGRVELCDIETRFFQVMNIPILEEG